MFVIAAIGARPAPVAAVEFGPDLQVNSKRYIVIDADTGEVFASRDPDDQAAMASLTKVFTAIQALEDGDLDQEIVTEDSDLMDSTHSTMGFSSGETLTLEDLLYGLMLPSGNDAAHAIARELGYQEGDTDEEAVQRFVDRTNQRIKDTGLSDTNLVNPHGYGVPGHYSSAHDLAVFVMYAMRYPMFEELISTVEFTASNGQYLRNNNRLMSMGYESLIGGKTGFDNDSGYCLIEVARRDGNTMISVTMDGISGDDWYDDNRVLLNYALGAKAEREANDDPIENPVVAFLDPDAAMISRAAIGGASAGNAADVLSAVVENGESIGAAGVEAPAADADSVSNTADQVFANPSSSRTGLDSGAGREIWAVIGVALLVFAARGLGAFATPFRRARFAPGPGGTGPAQARPSPRDRLRRNVDSSTTRT